MHLRYTALAGALMISGGVCAQSTLGDVIDAGGVRLAAAEARAFLTGATVSGSGASGMIMRLTLQESGKASGHLSYTVPHPGTMGLSGVWRVEDDGKVCSDPTTTTGRGSSICGFCFSPGDGYYGAPSETDRAVAVTKRTVSR